MWKLLDSGVILTQGAWAGSHSVKLKLLVLFPCMFTQSRLTAWISQSALPLLCVVTVISTVSHSSLDRATLNYTLVTDCSQSVKIGCEQEWCRSAKRESEQQEQDIYLAQSCRTIDFYIDFPVFTAETQKGAIDFRYMRVHCLELLLQGSRGQPPSLCVSISLTSHTECTTTHTQNHIKHWVIARAV